MKRSGPPRRSRPMARSGRIKAKPRSQAEAERVYGPKAFRDWLHEQPCAVTGLRGGIVQAHAKTGGMGRKADWTETFPALHPLHVELHRIGQRTFEAKYGVVLVELAAQTQAKWQRSNEAGL